MTEVPLPIRVATDFWSLLGILLVLVVLCHATILGLLKLDKVGLKRLDYFWLGIAAIGLIKTAGDTRAWWATSQLPSAARRLDFSIGELQSRVVQNPPRYLSTEFIRTEYSPPEPEFSNVQAQYRRAWEWVKSLPPHLPVSPGPPYPKIDFAKAPPPDGITDPNVESTVQWIQRLLNEYESRRKEYEVLMTEVKRTDGEAMYLVFGPILLCLALAIRITKVTGEIRMERKAIITCNGSDNAEQSHPPEPAAGPVSNGESSPPAR